LLILADVDGNGSWRRDFVTLVISRVRRHTWQKCLGPELLAVSSKNRVPAGTTVTPSACCRKQDLQRMWWHWCKLSWKPPVRLCALLK
jgi:hypothetical protein